jgi:hypothetical protein
MDAKVHPFRPPALSAAPAPISRHRFHLCRAVAMFGHSGASRRQPQRVPIAGSRRGCKGGWGKVFLTARPPGTHLIRFPVDKGNSRWKASPSSLSLNLPYGGSRAASDHDAKPDEARHQPSEPTIPTVAVAQIILLSRDN